MLAAGQIIHVFTPRGSFEALITASGALSVETKRSALIAAALLISFHAAENRGAVAFVIKESETRSVIVFSLIGANPEGFSVQAPTPLRSQFLRVIEAFLAGNPTGGQGASRDNQRQSGESSNGQTSSTSSSFWRGADSGIIGFAGTSGNINAIVPLQVVSTADGPRPCSDYRERGAHDPATLS